MNDLLKYVLREKMMKMIRNDVLNELGERQSRAGRFRTVIMLVLGLLIVHASPALLGQSGDSGTITGQLVDAQTGDPLIGANVLIDGTLLGASTDLDGLFVVTGVPAGTYTIVVDYVGYAQTRIEAVEVKAGESARLSLAMAPEAIQGDVVVVEARLLENTDASLLKKRQKAAAVSDAISAEEISRSGSSDAADAMSRVTGASVVGGKYVYVRGLGDRYSNTQLNGAELPSADPDKKAVQMDLFPSNLLDNIVTQKTFTPDQPGNFSGGIVNIGTKSFPDGFTLKFSTTSSYNTRSTFSDNILTYPGGDLDWLGMDDGTRDIPDLLADPDITIPNVGEARNNAALAQELDAFSKAFNPVMAPTTRSGPVNQSYAFSVGNNISLFGRPLGYIGSISYSRKFDAYEDGEVGGWQLTGRVSETDSLKDNYRFSDRQGSEEVSWGGLATLAYKPHPGHEISLNYMHSQSGESKSRYLNGILLRDLSPSDTFETRVLGYTERNIRSFQL
ncbi:MAG: carboxypeptidase-like regulatory domain-containing protein, partial [Calditrichaeota bacterium]|nr:carboxypeptidase-like regulatory domain-containing protein [Calditrichota bacterium]